MLGKAVEVTQTVPVYPSFHVACYILDYHGVSVTSFFWLCWVFLAAHGLLLLWTVGSRECRLTSRSAQPL